MKDLEMAKSILMEEDQSLVLVKNSKVIYKSSDKGIRPIYELYNNYGEESENGAIADIVIGRGAALLLKNLNIKSLYSKLISEWVLLELNNIGIFYDKKVKNILNRDKSDLCPIEKLSKNIIEGDEMNEKIKEFLKIGK